MDDRQLVQALGELNRRMTVSTVADPHRTTACFTYSRARAVALDPTSESADECAHRSDCRRCRQAVAGFARHLPHLSVWTLIRMLTNSVLPAEEERVEYHFRAGRCRECAERAAVLAQSPLALLQVPPPTARRHPGVVRAAVAEPVVLVQGRNGDFAVELARDGEKLSLEVQSRNPAQLHGLVTYVFESASGEPLLDGYLVLGADAEGWYAAQYPIDAEQYRTEVSNGCRSLQVLGVRPAFLNAEEWRRVIAAAPNSTAKAEVKAAWLEFCRNADARSDVASDALRTIVNGIDGRTGLSEAGEHVRPV